MAVSVPGNSCRTSRYCSPLLQGCLIRLAGECVYYSGSSISAPGINTGDNFNVVVNKIINYASSGAGTVTSVAASITSGAISIGGSPITSAGTLAFTYAGASSEYIRGDGSLATFPTAVPTLEQVLTAGSIITTSHSWNAGTNVQLFTGTNNTSGNWQFSNSAGGITISASATGTGVAISASNNSTGNGLTSTTSSGIGGLFTSTTGLPLSAVTNPASANTVVTLIQSSRNSSVAATNGIGTAWEMQNENSGGNLVATLSQRSVSTNVTAGAVDAEYQIWTATTNTLTQKLTIKPSGQTQLNLYGSNTFVGTPTRTLQVDSTGNIIEGVIPIATANNGLTAASTVVVLGQNLNQVGNPAVLTSVREIPLSTLSVRFTGTGYIQSNCLKITGQNTAGDGFPAGITQYGRVATVNNNQFGYGIQEYSFVNANTGFRGYLGVQSWPYITGAAGSGIVGKFAGYVNGFSTAPIWDGTLGGGPFQLATMLGFFSALQTQAGGILDAYDHYCSEINTVGGTTQNPAVVNHYAFYAEPFIYATNNFGIYINGNQLNYFGGKVGIGNATVDASAKVQIDSTTLGFLPPRMTTTQRNAIATPAAGLMVYDTDLNKLFVHTTVWEQITSL